MGQLRFATVFVGIVVCLGPEAQAATYYVSPTGDDLNAGVFHRPFRTFNHSFSVLAAGDVLILLPGTFHQALNLAPLGTPARTITIRAQTPGSAVIETVYDDGVGIVSQTPVGNLVLSGLVVNGTGYGIYLEEANHVTLKGCEVRGGYQAVRIANGSNLVVQDCNVHDNRFGYLFGFGGTAGIAKLTVRRSRAANNSYEDLTGNTDGFFVESNCTAVSLQDCVAYGHGDSGFDVKPAAATVERCRSYGNGVCGFKFWRENALLANSVAYDNGAYGLIVGANGMRVWNCTLGPSNGGYSMQLESPDPATVLIRNTIFAFAPINIMAEKMYNDNCNLYYIEPPNALMIWVGWTAWRINRMASGKRPLGPRSLVANPLFANLLASDYSLRSGSPARGKGIWNSLYARDVLGRPRRANEPPDLGAYAYVPAASPPAALALRASAIATPGGSVQLQVTSSQEATAEVTIRNLAGQPVALLPTTPLTAGSSVLLWNGRSLHGTVTAQGSYFATVKACTTAGQQASVLVRIQK